MDITKRFFLALFLIVLSGLYILPWKQFGIDNDFLSKSFVLWLDLQGGVELDYQVDLSALEPDMYGNRNENPIVEGLKKIIDKRVSSLGLSEPTIQTAKYGTDTHIIVQIPTESYKDLTPEEEKQKQQEDITRAKDVIWKVVQLEFKERRTEILDSDYEERRKIADQAKQDMLGMDINTVVQKYSTQYENVKSEKNKGELPEEAKNIDLTWVKDFPYITDVVETTIFNPYVGTSTGYLVLNLKEKIDDNKYDYSYVLVDSRPSNWKSAVTQDGKILNDKYLVSATAGISPAGTSEVQLTFNDEWKAIFAELTQRLIGQQIAIFVGWQELTAPTVQAVITNGQAVITGQSSLQESQQLANDITTGIVPAPIYLTSERTIDAKIGESALSQILIAGFIGLWVIIFFLVAVYRVGGLLAGVALVTYALFLIALVKFFGVVLTLASIAGVILSIGLAIDANILIFERTHEALKDKLPLTKAISIGFKHSWTAIWDSHITSFMSALILYLFGVSLIQWFGFMLGIGILLSLFTAMWISRILILFAAKFIKNANILVGYKK